MVREIKTTLEIDGEKRFKEALASANREMQVMNADLRAMAAEFSSTDDAQKYFAQRSDMLNDKVKQQEQIVEALNQAVKDSAAKYGDAARQTDEYRIKLSNATASLFKMRQEAEEAGRELEDLGRDGNKIGRQLENGIGDAAEEVSEKLDGMFAKVSADVKALKGSVAFQTTMDVGGFVIEGIQSVMGFVQENQELNRRLAQTRTVVEMYGYNADKILEIATYAASVIGDFESAQEAVVNLAGAGFESEEAMRATVEGLLGAWLSSGGTMDFSELAESYLETVKTKTPTGAFAEAVTKFTDRTEEDVQKVLESMTSTADVLEGATAILTEAGLQSRAKTYAEENAGIVDAENANIQLAMEWAELAGNIQPVVTGLINGTKTLVGGINDAIDWLEGITWEKLGKGYEEFLQSALKKRNEFNDKILGADRTSVRDTGHAGGAGKTFGEVTATYEAAGAETFHAYEEGFLSASEESTAAEQTVMGFMVDLMAGEQEAWDIGKNAMINFASGIVEGGKVAISSAAEVVTTIKAILAQINVWQLAYAGIVNGSLHIDRDDLVNTVSHGMRQRVDIKNYLK